MSKRRKPVLDLSATGLILFVCLGLSSGAGAHLEAQSVPEVAAASARQHLVTPRITGSDGSQTGTASFLGNFNNITDPAPSEFVLQRQADCSLNIVTATESGLGPTVTFNVASNVPHYERTLHQMAALTTTANVFPKGCAEKSTGISSRVGVYVGSPLTGIGVVALIVPDASNVTAIRTRAYNIAALTATQTTLRTIVNPGGLATADLNGDGVGDLAVVNYSPFVWVMLGNSDGTFKTPTPYEIGGSGSEAAVIDDVTGDGKLDLIVASKDQVITIFPGAGNGTFVSPLQPIYVSGNANTPIQVLITADLRGIGRKDIICDNGIVLLNNGDGTFTQLSTLAFPFMQTTTAGQPLGIASGDINGDGKIDLVTTTGEIISTWLGKGDGTFTAGRSFASINNTGYITLSDLDGDGNLDIYTGQANGGLYSGDVEQPGYAYALMGHGDGTFQGAASISGSYTGTNLGDVNGDGIPDLIVAAPGQSNLTTANFTVELGDGKGGFNPVSTVPLSASFTLNGYTFPANAFSIPGYSVAGYALGDIDGDGKADLVFAVQNLIGTNSSGPTTITTSIYFVAHSNGDGTFAAPLPYMPPPLFTDGSRQNLTLSSLHLADVTRDGKLDIVAVFDESGGPASNYYNRGVSVIPGNGNGTFSTTGQFTTSFSSPSAPNTLNLPAIAGISDLNGDGKPDILITIPVFSLTSGATTQLQSYLGNGDGTFGPATLFAGSSNVKGTPVLADFDKDGKTDIAILAETANEQAQLVVARGNGDGTFAPATILNLSGGDAIGSSSLAGADFDGDGKVDLALLDSNATSGVFYGKGDGTFTSVPNGNAYPKDLIDIYTSFGAAGAVDLNKDGKPDILSGSTVLINLYGAAPTVLTTTTTTLTSSANAITAGGSVSLTATVATTGTGTPTGSVSFLDGTTPIGSGTLTAGKATFTTTFLAAGGHTITAVYSGDTTFATSTSTSVTVTVTAIVTPIATTTTLTASAISVVNPTVISFTATVAPASGTAIPTGSVVFSDSGATLATVALDSTGKAAYAATLAVGNHSIVASYQGVSGTTIFTASASTPLGVIVTAPVTPGFTVALSSTTGTVAFGSAATTMLSVTPTGGFSQPTALTCTGSLTAGTTCTISPTSVTPSGTTASTATVTLQTSAIVGAVAEPHPGLSFAAVLPLAAFLPVGLFGGTTLLGLGLRRTRQRTLRLLAVTAVTALIAATGCGGKAASPSTTSNPHTYVLTVTATSGSIAQSATWTVTAQ